MTEQEELEYLKQNSPMALPDDPSSSGWSAAQIKEKHYAGLFFLYNLFKANRQNLNQAVSDMQEIVDSINEEYEEIINGKNVSAKWDDENNEIKTTYAKILNITNGTIKVLKYIKENGTDDYIYNIEKNLSTLTTNFNTLKTWTDNLKDINSDTSVLRAVQATKDGLGNIINETYATIASLNLTSAYITNIVNGTTIVGKAYNDQLGRRIDTTYIRIADIINVLNDTSTNKPLSAAKGKDLQDQITAINTLLASNDTDLDTIQEIVTYIKSNKSLIENITSDKMSYSVLVKNLTTNNDNLPLSASMGYALKAMIDAINDVEDGIEAAEALRVIAEAGRVEAEEARQTGYSGFDGRITANANAISGIKDGTNLDSFSDVESALSDKADSSDVYDKTEVYTKAEAEALINAKCKETADNLRWELGTYDLDVESDSTVAYQKTTPTGALSYASLDKLGGMSYKCHNLANNPTITNNASSNYAIVIAINNLSLKANQTYTISFTSNNTLASNTRFYIQQTNVAYIDTIAVSTKTNYSITFTPNADSDYLNIRVNNITTGNTGTITNVMLNEGSTVLPYQPYFTDIRDSAVTSIVSKDSNDTTIDTYTIPSEVQALNGYGWGINDTCYNYIDFENKKFIQKVGRVDLGSLNYSFISETNRFFSSDLVNSTKAPINNDTIANILTNNYQTVYLNYLVGYPDLNMIIALSNTGNLSIRNNNYTNAQAFKTAMNGVYLYYELATPIETDISQYIDDNFIEVAAGGSITANNTYSQAVPSEIDYLIEEVKA